MNGGKRKKVVLTIEQKLNAVKRLDAGETSKKIALELGVGTSTVGDWKKKREQLEEWSLEQALESGIKGRKTMKKDSHRQISEALFLWYKLMRGKDVPITGPLLQEKALKLKNVIEGESSEFTACGSWIDRWKKRYGLKQITIGGESLTTNKHAVNDFKKEFHKLIEDEKLSGDQIYNCNETRLSYKMMPPETLLAEQELSTPGHKTSSEQVTLLACSNASGAHKLRLALTGMAKKPRAFKKLNSLESLPVWCTTQEKAWMNGTIFKEWFFEEFVPSVDKFLKEKQLPRKAVLLMDNSPSHPISEELQDGDIKVVLLPPNVTYLCQPMDQGVLEALKKKYHRRILSSLIEGIENNEGFVERLKQTDILDVLRWGSESWDEISQIALVRSWRRLLDHQGDEYGPLQVDDSAQLVSLLQAVPGCESVDVSNMNKWVRNDESREITDEEIVAMVSNDSVLEEEEEEDLNSSSNKILHSDALKAIETLLEYVPEQNEGTAVDVFWLLRWREITAKKRKRKKVAGQPSEAASSAWSQDDSSSPTPLAQASDCAPSTSGRSTEDIVIKQEKIKEELILEDYGNSNDSMEFQSPEEAEGIGNVKEDVGVAQSSSCTSEGPFETIICGTSDVQIKQEIFEDESDAFDSTLNVEPMPSWSVTTAKESEPLSSQANTGSPDVSSKTTTRVPSPLHKSYKRVSKSNVKRSQKLLKAVPALSLEKCQICVNEVFSSPSDLVEHCILKHSDASSKFFPAVKPSSQEPLSAATTTGLSAATLPGFIGATAPGRGAATSPGFIAASSPGFSAATTPGFIAATAPGLSAATTPGFIAATAPGLSVANPPGQPPQQWIPPYISACDVFDGVFVSLRNIPMENRKATRDKILELVNFLSKGNVDPSTVNFSVTEEK